MPPAHPGVVNPHSFQPEPFSLFFHLSCSVLAAWLESTQALMDCWVLDLCWFLWAPAHLVSVGMKMCVAVGLRDLFLLVLTLVFLF